MNAKVQIQLSEQLIPFYTANDVIKAYALASEASVQLRTLFNQIKKSTEFVKSSVGAPLAHSSLFTEIENLLLVAIQLTDIQIDNYITHKKIANKSTNLVEASDLLDVYGLAHEAVKWLNTLCLQVNDECRKVKETLKEIVHNSVFSTLEQLIHIAGYISENHVNTFQAQCDKYEAESEANNE